MRRTFKFRAYPNLGTRKRLRDCMRDGCKRVINNAIAERYRNFDAIMVAKQNEQEPPKWVSAYDQYHWIRKKDHPELAKYPIKPLQVAITTVDGAFKSFRALLKNGHKDADPPNQVRFVSWLTYHQNGWRLDGDVVWLSKMGPNGSQARLRFHKHREIEGQVKSVTIREKNGKWYVCFSCEADEFSGACGSMSEPKSIVGRQFGQKHDSPGVGDPESGGAHNLVTHFDTLASGVGDPESGDDVLVWRMFVPPSKRGRRVKIGFLFWHQSFLCDSEGRELAFPAFYESELDVLARLNRELDRKQKAKAGERPDGSFRGRNRRRARQRLARWHEHIANRRDYWLWHVARFYVANYDVIEIPKWPFKDEIHYAVDSEHARRLCDGSYGKFVGMLKQKAEQFHKTVVEVVNPELVAATKARLECAKAYEDHRACVRWIAKELKRRENKGV